MGHIVHNGHAYGVLQKRLIRKVQGATESPVLMKILTMLFSPEDAELAAKMPHKLVSLETLSRSLNIPEGELRGKLADMARRGLVFDMEHKGRSYYVLPPVIVGLFEFIFMRARPDMPMKELAGLFEEYFRENDYSFSRTVFAGRTQMFRTLVREETIPPDSYAEVLDWERAAGIVASASAVAVGICQCHHLALHQGKACGKPGEVCLTFNYGAEGLARSGIARTITKNEAMSILLKCKELGLAQIADNVQNRVSYMCNCCKCCCHVMDAIRTLDHRPGITTSNYIMEVDAAKCKGCGKCAAACPVDAITMETELEGGRPRKRAVRNEQACLGCGVCVTVCKNSGNVMRSRPQRVLVPENVFEQRVMMAIERGKLAELIFDNPGKLSHRALGRVFGALERSAPVKAMLAAQTLNSAFMKGIANKAMVLSGDAGELFVDADVKATK
jgi:ferredoxin